VRGGEYLSCCCVVLYNVVAVVKPSPMCALGKYKPTGNMMLNSDRRFEVVGVYLLNRKSRLCSSHTLIFSTIATF